MQLQVSAFLDSLEASSACSRSTRLAYASDLRVFLDFLLDLLQRPVQIADLDAGRVRSFLEFEQRQGRKPSTLSRRLSTLRKFNLYLSGEGLSSEIMFIPAGGLAGLSASSSSSSCVPPPFLTQDQVTSLFSLIGTSPHPRAFRDQALLMLLAETGLSVSSVAALNLTDLDLRARRLHLVSLDGEDIWISLGMAHPAVERYIREGRPDLNHRRDEPALFISQLDGRLTRQGIWQILHAWGLMLDPPLNITPRQVRHTAVIRLARSGKPLSEIQTVLGHRNPFSTQALIRRLKTAELQATMESNV